MEETTHIVPVGHTGEKLLQGIRRFPAAKVIILIGDKPGLSGEPKARKTALELTRSLEGYIEVTTEEVSKEDVNSAVLTIIEIIRTEQKAGRKVLLNVSGSMRTLGIACYIAACMTNTKVYATLSKYDEKGKVVGVEKVYELPLFTLKDQPPERIEILQALGKGSAGSVEDLIERLDPKLEKGDKAYDNERSRLSYHLRALEDDGLVKTEKIGKSLAIKLTPKGEIYLTKTG